MAIINRTALLGDPTLQETMMRLVFDTEMQTRQICGTPAAKTLCSLCLQNLRRQWNK